MQFTIDRSCLGFTGPVLDRMYGCCLGCTGAAQDVQLKVTSNYTGVLSLSVNLLSVQEE